MDLDVVSSRYEVVDDVEVQGQKYSVSVTQTTDWDAVAKESRPEPKKRIVLTLIVGDISTYSIASVPI